MKKYELLKKVDSEFAPDVVEKEYISTNSWKDILHFVKNYQGTTFHLGLHVRFISCPQAIIIILI